MMVRLGKRFRARWHKLRLDDVLGTTALQPRLFALVHARFVRKDGGLMLEPLARNAPGAVSFPDVTGLEAFVNKVHVDDFIDASSTTGRDELAELVRQGVKAALALGERLEKCGKYRVLLSLDAALPTIALRFFERREGEPWGAEDPDAFELEDVMMIDTGP